MVSATRLPERQSCAGWLLRKVARRAAGVCTNWSVGIHVFTCSGVMLTADYSRGKRNGAPSEGRRPLSRYHAGQTTVLSWPAPGAAADVHRVLAGEPAGALRRDGGISTELSIGGTSPILPIADAAALTNTLRGSRRGSQIATRTLNRPG
jgi:hypothetical protein